MTGARADADENEAKKKKKKKKKNESNKSIAATNNKTVNNKRGNNTTTITTNNNSNKKWTSTSNKSQDMQVLREQLNQLNLSLKDVSADGNCLFRAICDQRDGCERANLLLRDECCLYMEQNEEDFRPFVEDDEEWEHYLRRMRKDGTWAGNMEVQACARVLKMRICVHRANQPRWILSPYFSDGSSNGSDSNNRRSNNNNNNNNNDMDDDDCAYHLAYDADRGCEHYNSVRMTGTLNEDFAGGPISLKLITDAQTEIFEIAQKTGFARDIARIRRHLKMSIEENSTKNHEKVINRACETLLEELENEKKTFEQQNNDDNENTNEDGENNNKNNGERTKVENGGWEEDDGGWERVKAGRAKRRGKNKSIAEEYEALTL